MLNQATTSQEQKKAYATPALVVHGDVQSLTQKTVGNSAGIDALRQQ